MKFTNKHNLPQAVFDAVTSSDYNPGESDYSATGLLKPPQISVLTKRYWDQIEEEAMERVWSLLGQAAHHILERHGSEEAIAEKRLYAELEGKRIGGQVDHYMSGVITDYKVTSAWSLVYKSKMLDWEQQLNIYAYLFETSGYPVNKLQIVTILRDWSKQKASQDNSYPQSPIVVVDIPVWDQQSREEFIKQKINQHVMAERLPDENLPHCTAEDMWEEPTKYAVYKNKNKRATRVCDTLEEAELVGSSISINGKDTDRIEVRHGKRRRCEEYCPVKDFCHQYKEYLNANDRNEN